MKNFLIAIFLFFLTSLHSQNIKITMFRDSALDCHWNPANKNRIAYSFKGKDHYYDIYIASPDRKFDTCITKDHPLLPNRHICLPSWHPSGKWIIFVAEKK